VISPAQFDVILSFVRKRPFRNLLIASWETGCRPQESLIVEARHVDLANSRWVFPPDESKGDQWPRIVYLTDKALEITKRLMKQLRTGPLFRNTSGKPWTTDAVNCASRLCETGWAALNSRDATSMWAMQSCGRWS
jgi:integrase